MKSDCGCSHAKCNNTPKGKMCPKHGMEDCTVKEGNLHQWFKGSKSKDGKPGWVNVVTGGTCASDEPGEGTPKCVSSSKRASMSKSERLSASRRKKSADPGQQSKSGAAKPTYVSTDVKKEEKEMQEQSFTYVIEGEDDKGKGSGEKDACYHKVKAKYDVWPSAYASGALVKCRKAGAKNWGNKSEDFIPEDHKEIASGKRKDEEGYMARVEFDQIERAINILRKQITKGDQQIPAWVQSKITRAADFIDTAAEYMQSDEEVSEACWKGYKQVGMKKKGEKVVPNCVREFLEQKNYVMPNASQLGAYSGGIKGSYRVGDVIPDSATKPKPNRSGVDQTGLKGPEKPFKEDYTRLVKNGQTLQVSFTWRGLFKMMKIFFPSAKVPSRQEVQDAIRKFYPQAVVTAYGLTTYDPSQPMVLANEEAGASKKSETQFHLQLDKLVHKTFGPSPEEKKKMKDKMKNEAIAIVLDPNKQKKRKNYLLNNKNIGEGAAWTRKEGQNKKGGLNEKGRKSYERENPGSDLKAPSKKVGNPRRASFCARMKGMKDKRTSKKTANDPNSRINKSLRAWNC